MINRSAQAKWQGDLKTGTGSLSTDSGTLKDTPYSFHARFEQGQGTNPEEAAGRGARGLFHHGAVDAIGSGGIEGR